MNELSSSHILGLDEIAMTMPYNQTRGDEMMDEEDEVEEIGESQVKRKPRTGNYKIDEDEALFEAWLYVSLDAMVADDQTK